VTGAVIYDIYRTTAGTSPSSTGKIGSTISRTFLDTGLAGDSTTAPTTNTTGIITGQIAESGGFSSADGLTAHAGGTQAGALQLAAVINRVATVASTADSVALPLATAGGFCIIVNDASNALQAFGAGTDTINDVATATGIPIPGKSMIVFSCATAAPAGKWYSGAPISVAAGKSLTVNNILTLAGTDATTMTFPGTSDTVVTLAAAQTLTNKTINGSQLVAASVTSTQIDPQTIQYATVTPTVANFINMNSVGVPIVAAQGPGTYVEIISILINLGYGSAPFASGGAVGAYVGTTSAGTLVTGILAATIFTTFSANKIATCYAAALGSTADASGILNTGVVLSNPNANFTGGTGATITIKVAYRVHNTLV
jgi:hypothetical protein